MYQVAQLLGVGRVGLLFAAENSLERARE